MIQINQERDTVSAEAHRRNAAIKFSVALIQRKAGPTDDRVLEPYR